MNILLLDADHDILKSLKTFLELHEYECESVDDPVNALSLECVRKFDIMISEYFSNDSNYELVFREIRKRKLPTKIVVLTSINYNISDLKSLHDLDITTILKKPVKPELLLQIIEKFGRQTGLQIPKLSR